MNRVIEHTTHHLKPFDLLLLASAAPGVISVTGGNVWLTGGDGVDVFLSAGDTASFDDGQTPIASCLGGPATVDVTRHEPLARAA